VLLAADPDASDFFATSAEFLKNLGDGALHGCKPEGGILFHGTLFFGLNKSVGLLGGCQDVAGTEIQGDGFGALGAAIDAESNHGVSEHDP
jgi:hypothetical protein